MRGGATLDVFQSAGAGGCFNLLRPMLQLIGAVEKEVMSGATLRDTNSGRAQALSDPAGKTASVRTRHPERRRPRSGPRTAGARRSSPTTGRAATGATLGYRCERDTNTRPLPRLAAASSLVLPCVDGPRLGERQAAVSQDQRCAAHDLIPQFRSRYTNPGSYEIYQKTGEFPGRGRSSRHASRRKISTR